MKLRKPIIGLAGGIGSGKSMVARILQSLGAAVIDSDQLAHVQLNEPEVVRVLREWWGESVCPSGTYVDRRAIADIVFRDPDQLAKLESLLYPRIDRQRRTLMEAYEVDPAVRAVVWDAPKLHEAGLDKECDAVIFVESDRASRLERVLTSRGWREPEVTLRENLQKPLDTKKANADYVVLNNSSIEDLRTSVEQVFLTVLKSFC